MFQMLRQNSGLGFQDRPKKALSISDSNRRQYVIEIKAGPLELDKIWVLNMS